ncbi:hypothetical protein WDW86_03220 [Bdellovibrionota bacterium FG-2]
MPKYFVPQGPIQWSWVELAGPDARDFLHRMSTSHVKGLQPGQGCTSCFLNAKGHIQAYFWLWCLAPERFAFEFDAGSDSSWKTGLLNFIERHHFSEQMELRDSAPEPVWILGESPEASAQVPGSFKRVSETHWICHHGSRDYGEPLMSVWGDLAPRSAHAISFEELERLRIQRMQPRVGMEITGETNPLEVNLRHTLSDQKGCYPGQEVIERILTQGTLPRRLCKIKSPSGTLSLTLLNRVEAKLGTTIEAGINKGTVIEISTLD